jgi:hypothetical protein
METYSKGVVDKLEQVSIQYNAGILKLFTTDREFYETGKFDEWGTPQNLQIFGKSNYTDSITNLFSSLLSNVDSDSLTLISEIKNKKNDSGSNNLKKYKQNIKNLINGKKDGFESSLNNISNELINAQLPVVRSIDKINYVIQGQGYDGYIDKQGNPLIFSATSATTITNLKNNSNNITSALNNIINALKQSEIITNNYNFVQTYSLISNSFNNNPSDKRFYLVFANDLINDIDTMVDKLSVNLPSDWKKDIKSVLEKPYKEGANAESKAIKNIFKKYKKDNTNVNNYYGSDWNKWRKDDRDNGLVKVDNPSDDLKNRLKNLYLTENPNSDDDTFNGKVKF